MRRLIALALLAGCASAAPPPGGPVDTTAPHLLDVSPDSGTIRMRDDEVVFRFDDVINDRVARGSLDQFFLISPRDGSPRVSWHRREIAVRPRRRFRSNTAYTVTKLPGLTDLRGNRDSTTTTIVFSTGATIPTLGILGRVFDWQGGRPATGAIVEAISRPDSTVYITATDTSGGFTLGPFGAGRYTLLAFIDANRNFELDRGEKWDSTQYTVANSRPFAELLVIERDTLPPRLTTVAQLDSVTVQLTFDRALDPGIPLTTSQFRLVGSDSAPLALARVITDAEVRAAEDSAQRARADSTRRADSARAAAAGLPPRPVSGRVTAPPLRPSRPAPPLTVRLVLQPPARLLPASSYRVTASDVRGLSGRATTSTRTFTTSRLAPPDTIRRPPGDSVRRPPR